MTPDELLAQAGNPNFISGIYNYCDRWCERCHMTSRCMLFAVSPENDDKGKAETSEDLFKTVHDSFSQTIELLQKIAAEKGFDLTMSPTEEAAFSKQQSLIRKTVESSPLSILANQYLKAYHTWLTHSKDVLDKKSAELTQADFLQIPGRHPLQEATLLTDTLDVIAWYHFQIPAKISRALSGKIDGEDLLDDDGNPFPKDSDGSAKVALIGIDRSIGAWGILLQSFAEQEGKILDLLTMLERLRRMVENEFPNARAFKRAGFDDPIHPLKE